MCERYTICCTCCEKLTVIYGYTMALGPVREWGDRDPLKKTLLKFQLGRASKKILIGGKALKKQGEKKKGNFWRPQIIIRLFPPPL